MRPMTIIACVALCACGGKESNKNPTMAPPDLSGDVTLSADMTVAAGMTVTVAAGTIFHAASGVHLNVLGTLSGTGTSAAPIIFQSQANSGPNGWAGIVIESGGTANLTYFQVHDADIGISAQAGSKFTLDQMLIDTSTQFADLESTGTVSHGVMHGLGGEQTINAFEIGAGSPTVSYVLMDQAGPSYDLVHTETNSSPTLDHLDLSSAHCAMHFNGGSGIVVSNSYIHNTVYGLMALAATGTHITNSNWEQNTTQIGLCIGGSVAADGVYFDTAPFDSTCTGMENESPASAPLSNVGAN